MPIRNPPNGVRHRRRYPWDRWFSRDKFVLHRGTDFPQDVALWGMRQMVARKASELRVKITTKISEQDESIEVRVVGPLPRNVRKGRGK